MNGVLRTLKYQLSSFSISLLKGIAIGLSIMIGMFVVFGVKNAGVMIDGHNIIENSPSTIYSVVVFIAVLVGIIAPIMLYVACFTDLLSSFKFSLRLGVTRKDFIVSRVIFFVLVIIIFTLVSALGIYLILRINPLVNVAEMDALVLRNYVDLVKIGSTMLFLSVSAISFIAILYFLVGWKIIGLSVLNYFMYAFLTPYKNFIDTITMHDYTLQESILIFVMIQAIISFVLLKYNDDLI